MTRRNLLIASAVSLLACTAHAATVGNEGFTVPPFKCFGAVAKNRYELTAAESDLSGASYDPETGNVFVVNNGDRKVYEISRSSEIDVRSNVLTSCGSLRSNASALSRRTGTNLPPRRATFPGRVTTRRRATCSW